MVQKFFSHFKFICSLNTLKKLGQYFGLYLLTLVPIAVHAIPPDLQTPAPVIYLSDNLNEKDKLGWCIDTVGRGFSDQFHAHSCKPNGGDVQFYYNEKTGQIVSATFTGKCVTLALPAAVGVSLGLVDCSTNATSQGFNYSTSTNEFRPKGNQKLCLVVGGKSQSAGPFMSRSLVLADCDSTEAKYKQWQITINGQAH